MITGDEAAMNLPGDEFSAVELPTEEEGEILREIAKIEDQKLNITSALLTLIVSVVLFASTGLFADAWADAWMLIPVLLFHELGHLAAMKVFGYRNLRMFFIPFLGAAVSGRNLNVAGWKKAVVALMGPLPGIVVGAALVVVSVMTKQEWLTKVALLMLVLNGFNLLPVLPFDGGWILHSTLFCRHPILDAAFRTLAVGALLFLGWAAGDWILMAVALPMAIALPAAFRVANLAAELRKSGLVESSLQQTTIPIPTALVIASRVRATFPPGLSKPVIARWTLNIFETLNSRPPGWLASLAILFVHAGAFLLAAVFSIVSFWVLNPPAG